MRKQLVITMFLSFLLTVVAEESQGPQIEKEIIKKIQVFMELDRASLSDDDPKKINKRKYFFVRKNSRRYKVQKKDCGYKMIPGVYRVFEIYNDVNSVGATMRSVAVSPKNEVFWIRTDDSLKERFLRGPHSAGAGGGEVAFLFTGSLETVIKRFEDSIQVEFLKDYKPLKEEMEEYNKKFNEFTNEIETIPPIKN